MIKTEILIFTIGFLSCFIPSFFYIRSIEKKNEELAKQNIELDKYYERVKEEKREWVELASKRLTAKQQLEIVLEQALKDKEQAINWTCVAILECGHGLNSEWATKYNNLFGLSYNNKPHIFENINDCLTFLKQWINNNPNDKNLPFAEYMIDKGWATDPNYIVKFNSVRENYAN